MEDLHASTRGKESRPSASPDPVSFVRLPGSYEGEHQSALSAPLEASLRLAASLLGERADRDVVGELVIDLDLGGYHWTVSRCIQGAPNVDHQLSPRELEIVRMVACGLTNRAIAAALDISPWTVATYLRRVFGKLEVNSRAAMVARAIDLGLYPGTDDLPLGDSFV